MGASKSRLKGKRILAVDDEVDILETIEDILDEAQVDRAQDYETASAKIRGGRYDLAVLDIMGVDGLKLLDEAVERGIPAVMLTAHAINPETLMASIRRAPSPIFPKRPSSSSTRSWPICSMPTNRAGRRGNCSSTAWGNTSTSASAPAGRKKTAISGRSSAEPTRSAKGSPAACPRTRGCGTRGSDNGCCRRWGERVPVVNAGIAFRPSGISMTPFCDDDTCTRSKSVVRAYRAPCPEDPPVCRIAE